VEHLRQMSRGYEDQARAVEGRIAQHQAEVQAAQEAARQAHQRADRVEAAAAASTAEAAEHAAIARAAIAETTREREGIMARSDTVEADGRKLEQLRKQVMDEAATALAGREKVLREWEGRMEQADHAAKAKARDAEDGVRRWAIEVGRCRMAPIKLKLKALGTKRLKLKYDGPLSNSAFKFNLRRYVEVKRREDAAERTAEEARTDQSKVEQTRRQAAVEADEARRAATAEAEAARRAAAAEAEQVRKETSHSDAMRADAQTLHSAAEGDRAAAAKLKVGRCRLTL